MEASQRSNAAFENMAEASMTSTKGPRPKTAKKATETTTDLTTKGVNDQDDEDEHMDLDELAAKYGIRRKPKDPSRGRTNEHIPYKLLRLMKVGHVGRDAWALPSRKHATIRESRYLRLTTRC
jgi:hypothetical protein